MSRERRRVSMAGICLGSLLALVVNLAAPDALAAEGSLLRGIDGLEQRALDDPAVLRSRAVAVDFELLRGLAEKGNLIDLGLFDDLDLAVRFERVEKVTADSTSYVGRVEGDLDSRVVLVEGGGQLVGSVARGEDRFRIRWVPGGYHLAEEVDVAAYPSEYHLHDLQPSFVEELGPQLVLEDSGARFDVLVVYTPSAASGAGGIKAMENLIALGISETNVAFGDSAMIPQLRLVHTEQVSYSESGDIQTDVNRLQNPSDGHMDNVHALRNQYGADLVKLVVENGAGFCGIAFDIMAGSNNTAFENKAFCVTARGCISPNYSFGHELGHLMGSNHAPDDPTGTGAFSYSFGYKDPGRNFRTIMAYDCPGGSCPRVLRWSNPNLTLNGLVTGTSTQNNALSIDNVRGVIANFRQEIASNTPPVVNITAPANGATVAQGSSVTFSGTASDAQDGNIAGSLAWTSSLNGAIGSGASFSTSSLALGSHTITASVTDSGGLSGSAQISLNVGCGDSTAPTVAITSPANGASVSGTVAINASASDNVGVTQVRFFIDGAQVGTDSSAPYSYSWNTAAATAGGHTLQARAFDACGNQGSSAVINVTVVGVPDIAVYNNATGAGVPRNSSVSIGSTTPGVPTSLRFQIRNEGNGSLVINNPAALVSGACFSLIETPVTPIAPAGTSYFRVRLQCSTPGSYSGLVSISSNDPDENPYNFTVTGTVTAPPAPDINVLKNADGSNVPQGSSVNIGTTVAGTPTSLRFQIVNSGNAALNLSNAASLVSGACFSQIETPVTPVPVGGISYFRVRLQCSTPGSYAGTVSIVSDDPDESPYSFTVTGTVTPAAAPDISVLKNSDGSAVPQGSSVNIGTTPAGTPTSLRFQIVNSGNAALNLSNAASLVSGTCFSQIETPVTPVPVGGTSFFRVRLQCSTPGSYAGTVSILSDDPDESPYSFTVTGTVQ